MSPWRHPSPLGYGFDAQPWDQTAPWPTTRHDHEPGGGRDTDCHRCGSPRLMHLTGAGGPSRQCCTCGWSCKDSRCPTCAEGEISTAVTALREAIDSAGGPTRHDWPELTT